ncbi:hypothetical protein Tco_0841337 [Tanacetum coccineum]|uniref:Uncharacterized protein n=1 Tax=Tanacetum coccineum TaxID=301880 RepID=A0ABQ5AW29_9ASTR
MIEKKEIEPDEEPSRGTLWLKRRVNKDGDYPDDEIRSVGDKLKETKDKIKEGTLKVDQGTDTIIVVLEGLVTKLKTQLAAQGGQLQSMPTQLTPPAVSLVDIHPVNSSADEEGGTTVVGCDQNDASIRKEMQKRETVKSVGAKKMTRSIQKDSSSQDSQSKENVSVLPQKSTIIVEGTIYKSDGKIMLHNKSLPKDCYKVSIDKSLVDAAFIPDVGNNGCTTVLVAVVVVVAMAKESSCLVSKGQKHQPSTIQMITVRTINCNESTNDCNNISVSSDAMTKEA